MQSTTTRPTTKLNKPILVQGFKGTAVLELQRLLTDRGFYKGVINGIFDVEVKEAVIAFQHSVFLDEDGVVGNLTWQALSTGAPVHMPILKKGSQGKAVIALQRSLYFSGDYRFVIDGYFDAFTELALRAFKQRCGLVVDGIVGDKTWLALSKIPH